MREIKFKAKRKDNGEWAFGTPTRAKLKYVENTKTEETTMFMVFPDSLESECSTCDFLVTACEVIPETISEFTGLHDMNGEEIYENDIVFVTDDNGCSGQVDTGIGEIDFLEGLWYISGYVQNGLYDINKCFQIEVIGNAFDDSDSLETNDRKERD